METTNIRLMLTPPPPAIAVAREPKRARKRSRYLSPPFTDTDDDNDAAAVQEEDKRHEEEPPTVCAADALSALHAAALLDLESIDPNPNPNSARVDALALRFLALYRSSSRRRRASSALFANASRSDSDGSNKPPSPMAPVAGGGGGVGRDELLNLSAGAGPAISMVAHGSPIPVPAKKRKNPQDEGMVNAAALGEAGHKMPSQADFAVNATNGVANSAAPRTKRRKNKMMMMMKAGQEQAQQQFGNPVALVLDFAEGAPLPSKHDLLSIFRRFGFVIHPETAIAKDERSARVVFATRAQAEAAYSCAQTLGAFGPPFATSRPQDLPPITLNEPPPVPKLPLMDIRKNLEKMISSLTRRSSLANSPEAAKPAMGNLNLVGEMQGLLAKVDKMLQGASSTAHHH